MVGLDSLQNTADHAGDEEKRENPESNMKGLLSVSAVKKSDKLCLILIFDGNLQSQFVSSFRVVAC